ncbi:hypothetical protein NQ317_006539 [Molorchus minor]|uniref:Cyclic nucleotide-binding domain-containing protein n=1 Tax=Molorchus minor TaxID=1323400 RepID=A0ABQ9J8J9_9CUCU|nr:hypothetical protein NQ317_006539 [Molorchus minor]
MRPRKIYLIQKQSKMRLRLDWHWKKNEFLSNILQEKRLQHFIDSMYTRNVTEGDILIEEGEVGSHLYISKIGTYEITVQDNVVNIFNDMRVFGELAIIYSAKGNATVKCLENGTVWVLDCQIFNRRIIKTALEEQEEMVSFLKRGSNIEQCSYGTIVKYFTIGKEIVVEGEVGDTFYIIRAGTVTVLKDNDKVAQLHKGDFFGEFALLRDERHQSTVLSDAPGVECLTLTRKRVYTSL